MRWFSIYHVYRSNIWESTIKNFDDRDGFFGAVCAAQTKGQRLIFFARNRGFDLNQRRDNSRINCV
jgi:hypothetical protein